MRNPIFSDSEVETLRAQVCQLRHSVAELENRLAAFEGEYEADDENRWGIWPYCYFVAAWNFTQQSFQSFHKKRSEWNAYRRDGHQHLQSENQAAELRLT
ncbi:hypothetical protein B1R32_10443 [Abditibacterium utsteinense]|uniref:Uncharacterized protein n=1 Tax=Abditibacterium utsteinense TaxID=1960156 RepID=A0A2S8SUT1_9BACT|nr:hypothetical protein [Abditibacterium utsteinense]PQV64550.1 hypothetical protein B1R32_10443 [Abditibacterium utsteinense]